MAQPFGKVPVALALDPKISPEAVRVYAILCGKHANRSGQCYPSLRLLASEMHCSVRGVINFMAELREAGWVTRDYKSGKHGANLYTVHNSAQCTAVHSAPPFTVQNPAQDSAPPFTVHQLAQEPDPVFGSIKEPDPMNQTQWEGSAIAPLSPPKAKKPETEITPDFIKAMVVEFAPRLGGPERTKECIEAALNHKAMDKAKNKRIYLKVWLRHDAESYAARGGNRNGGTGTNQAVRVPSEPKSALAKYSS